MKTQFLKSVLFSVICCLFLGLNTSHGQIPKKIKGPVVVVESNPDGAEVYLNGQLACTSTPGFVCIPKKLVGKPIIFQFRKDGFKTKSMTLSYTKKELNAQPIIKCNLTNSEEIKDPTIRKGEAEKRVTRDAPGKSALERTIIRWNFDSDPRGARVFWRVISSVPDEVKNTNETYLTTTPYEETRSFNILGLTYENSRDITIEIKVTKRGYEDQVKRYNVRQAIDQQEISGFFELVKKDE